MITEKIKSPLVSVVIPVFNGSNYLKEAVDSALAQTYDNIEIIVVNDGSSDDTEKIAESYGDKIRYFSKENGGVASALNLGLKEMKGEYFSWLSHDDVYYPEKIEKQIKIIRMDGDRDLIVASPFSYIEKKDKIFGNSPNPSDTPEITKKHPLHFLFRGYINGCALLVNKSHFERVGNFNEKLPTTQDFDLWFRILRNARIKFTSDRLLLSRSHPEQASKAMLKTHVEECDRLWIFMFEQLTDGEKAQIDGSVYDFYKNSIEFLTANRAYEKCVVHAKKKMMEELGMAITSNNRDYNSDYLKQEVIKNTNVDNADELISFLESDANKRDECKRLFFPIYGKWSDRGGLNRMVSDLTKELSEKYKIFIVSPYSREGGFEISQEVTFIRIKNELNIEDAIFNLVILLKTDVYINSFNCTVYTNDILQSMKKLGINTVAWNHEHYFLPYWNMKYVDCCKNRNDIFGQSDAVVWLTNFNTDTYALFHNNSVTIPNFSKFKIEKRNINQDTSKRIISVGRHDDPRKRFEMLLKMFDKLLALCPDATLDIVGNYNLNLPVEGSNSIKTVGQLIEKINSDKKRIILSGFVNDVGRHYAEASVNVLCSYHEGFGLSLIEAAANGLPSVVFDDFGFDDIVDDNINGYIIRDDNLDQMAQKIAYLLNNPYELNRLSANTEKIISKFKTEKIIAKWYDLLDCILTSANEKQRNEFIKQRLKTSVPDIKKFVTRVACQYEESVKKLIKNKTIIETKQIYLQAENNNLQSEINRLQSNYQSLEFEYRNVLNSKAVRWSKKIKKYLRKIGIKNF